MRRLCHSKDELQADSGLIEIPPTFTFTRPYPMIRPGRVLGDQATLDKDGPRV